MIQVQGNNFNITYDPATITVCCAGILDLRGKEGYTEIAEMLDSAVDMMKPSQKVTLDVRGLEFLNSSGITTLGGFIIRLRKKGGMTLTIQCSNNHSWQARSMKGLERLMPEGLKINYE